MAEPSERTRIRRNAKRADYDADTIRGVLDRNRICHVAYVTLGGAAGSEYQPRIIPTLYMRQGEFVYLHGNRQSALLRHLSAGGLAALSVMSVEALVVARSGFHCSMNYHSVVLFGRGEPVAPDEHEAVLDAFVARLVPGHERRVRRATAAELAATAAVRLPIDEASAKIRTGPPLDDEGDVDADVWAGLIPLGVRVGAPVPSPDLRAGVALPDYIAEYAPEHEATS